MVPATFAQPKTDEVKLSWQEVICGQEVIAMTESPPLSASPRPCTAQELRRRVMLGLPCMQSRKIAQAGTASHRLELPGDGQGSERCCRSPVYARDPLQTLAPSVTWHIEGS